jgi:hypothetical protein
VTVSIKELREFVARKAFDLTAVLRSDVPTARQALANHVQKLVLTPKETPDESVGQANRQGLDGGGPVAECRFNGLHEQST